jgi:hypothetical protein
MTYTNQRICVVVRSEATGNFSKDPAFGKKLSDAIDEFDKTKKPQRVESTVQYRYGPASGIAAVVVGADISQTQQVYVIQESGAERVTSSNGSKAALDAMVEVLRGHGYTCVKRGQ